MKTILDVITELIAIAHTHGNVLVFNKDFHSVEKIEFLPKETVEVEPEFEDEINPTVTLPDRVRLW